MSPTDPPRLLLYSADLFGLGHLRKTVTIAAAVAARRPDVAMTAFTSVEAAARPPAPTRLDWVELPPAAPGAPLPPEIAAARRAIVEATIAARHPATFFVDHTPAGQGSELLYPLLCLRGGEPRATLVCGLSDVADDPATVRATWGRTGAHDLLDRTYDRIVVYGQPDIFDPPREYGLTPAATAKTEFVGYLSAPAPREDPVRVRRALGLPGGRLVVVTGGGGADAAPLLTLYLEACTRELLPADVVSLLVTGPRMEAEERVSIARLAAGLPRLTIATALPDLVDVLNAADLVVTMGGHNTLAEAVGLGKRTLVVPRVAPWREQLIRAERFAARGLVILHDPRDRSPERFGAAIGRALTGPPPAAALRFGGADRIADLLVAALGG